MSIANPVISHYDIYNRRIHLLAGVDTFHWIDDIYVEYRQARRLETDNIRTVEAFMVASGNESKGLGKATPRLLKLLLDAKVVWADEAGEKFVGGEAITDNADVDATLFDNSTITSAIVINYQPPAAEVIIVDVIAQALDYGGVLHYDATSPYSGQNHPVGTNAQPVNNMVDGLVIIDTFSLHALHTHSNVTLFQDVPPMSVKGMIPKLVFDANGFKPHNCRFDDMLLTGDFNDSLITANKCGTQNVLNIYGALNNCYYFGKIVISANQNLNTDNCQSGIPGLDSPEIDMNAGFDTTLSSRLYSGGLTITNCDTPNCTATLSFPDGGKPHIEPSCTDGLLSVRGSGFLDDRSNGSIVELSAWLQNDSIADAVWNKTLP